MSDLPIQILNLTLPEVVAEIENEKQRETASRIFWETLSKEDREATLELLARSLTRLLFRVRDIAPLCIIETDKNLFIDFRFRVLWSDIDLQRLKSEKDESMIVQEAVEQLRSSLKEFDVRSRETG